MPGTSCLWPSTKMRWRIIMVAGIPSQCALKDEEISPRNKKLMACPSPQPGHQLILRSFKGHKLKWAGA